MNGTLLKTIQSLYANSIVYMDKIMKSANLRGQVMLGGNRIHICSCIYVDVLAHPGSSQQYEWPRSDHSWKQNSGNAFWIKYNAD